MNREAIYNALFDKLRALPGLVTVSRRLLHWSDVESTQQPALFLAAGSQSPRQDASGLPAVWTLTAMVHIYVQTADPSTPPSAPLNDLLDALEEALRAEPGPFEEKQTLGGLCAHCWISGTVETDEGVLGDQAVATIPIEILVKA